ncbi:MAG: ribonuclease J [Rhodospirillaceae bacterium]|nr:ribonuclease J [Rhodospirillaceae bacterium]
MNKMGKRKASAVAEAWDEPKGLNKGLWFIPLGGAGEIGMNMNLFGCDGRWLMVDCGVTFGDDTAPGIDVVMPDPSFIEERRDSLDALVITHAHEDHLGAVAYLWPRLKCPVYATPFAAEFLKAKLAETGLTDDVPITILPLGGRTQIGPFDLEFVTLTHSIPEPNAVVIRTPHGALFHTGDWKFDPDPVIGEVSDYKKLEELGHQDILALIGDSTNVFTEGEAGSERDVRDTLTKIFATYTGRIAVGCFASNVARLDSIAAAAEANGRHVALVGQSLWRIVETARRTGYMSRERKFFEADEAAYLPRDKVVYICTGSQGEGRAALMRIAFNQHPDIGLEKGDVVVFSSRVIPGNEQAVHKVQNQLIRMGVELVTWRDEYIHVSGHPAREELKRMYGFIRPRIAVPVHGELMHMHAHAKLADECQIPQAVLVENGQALKFEDGRAEVRGSVWSGRLTWLEGEVRAMNDPIIKERKKLLYEGAVVVSVTLDDEGLADEPQVTVLGTGDPTENQDRDWDWIISNAIGKLPKKARRDDAVIEDAVKSAVRKAFAMAGRKPLVKVHISGV